jgi:hypothetical protein
MRSFVIPDTIKISAVFFALQMLILYAAELQIRQDEALSPGATGRAKPELCFYFRHRLKTAPSRSEAILNTVQCAPDCFVPRKNVDGDGATSVFFYTKAEAFAESWRLFRKNNFEYKKYSYGNKKIHHENK